MLKLKYFLAISVLSCLLVGCGGEPADQQEERSEPESLGGKADALMWIKHIPAEWGCDQTLSGEFWGLDSAHLYSFPGKVGYEYTFSFKATYPFYKGAVIAVFDSETGERVAHLRNRWSNEATLTYKAEKSIKYLVAVYSVSIWATGSYTLHAGCEVIFVTCQSSLSCGADEFCAFETGCGQSELGVCTEIPDMCNKIWAPVCGCDGQTYGNACTAATAGVSVDYPGECASTPPAGCEASGGYCEHFLSECKAGYVDGAPLDCPLGKSGKCCQPGAVVTTDDVGYCLEQPIEATLTNNTEASIFLPGCSVFSWQRQIAGNWVDQGPEKVCFWEGFAVEIKAADTFEEQLGPRQAGTWRLATSFGVGCKANTPLSQADCLVTLTIFSDPFEIEDCSL